MFPPVLSSQQMVLALCNGVACESTDTDASIPRNTPQTQLHNML